jgi:hypothetical protein
MRVTANDLFVKLRQIERALPADVRNQKAFKGLRIDECGQKVHVGATGPLAIDPWNRDFVDAVKKVGLIPGENEIAVLGARLSSDGLGCSAALPQPTAPQRQGTCAGERCFPATTDRLDYGTLGWFIYLDGIPVGVSNYHVVCKAGDATPLMQTVVNSIVDLGNADDDYKIGALHSFDSVEDNAHPIFDLALIRVSELSRLAGRFKLVVECEQCCAWTQKPYPLQLGIGEFITADDSFYMIGGQVDELHSLTFKGVGSRRWLPQRNQMFYEQLFFTPSSHGGDSGAIVVHSGTNTVVGLNSAYDWQFAVASPLYRKPWHYCGLKTVGGLTLPSFRTRCRWWS